eukprot:TRINITY_DN16795_c0_g1_i1.p1 TRINITY_DN16795_c0_g1~~TRINITY_DN16795_c0_g1_i1.p1  ORF type:complete len:603 (+),score=73.81 TRINITY_DN16795_c0_g1_i1:51-1859(+)
MMQGTCLEGFTLKQKIGQGTFGAVYTCTAADSTDPLVIKLISMESMTDNDQEACLTEVEVLAQLVKYNCNYLVRYITSFVSEESLCLVMEYADGGNLRQYLKENEDGLTTTQIVTFTACIATALHYVHLSNILHRDLKSANIFLNGRHCKIGDFGLSRVLTNPGSLAKSVVGTPYYVSPEMCNGKPYNSKTDLWSLGVIIFEMCTAGSYPFTANNQAALVLQIAQCKVDKLKLNTITNTRGSEFRKLLDSCLMKDPKGRPSALQVCSSNICYNTACREGVELPKEAHDLYKKSVCSQIRAHPLASVSTCNEVFVDRQGSHQQQQQQQVHLKLKNTIPSRRVRKGQPIASKATPDTQQRKPSFRAPLKSRPSQAPSSHQNNVVHSDYRSRKARERDINLVYQLPDVIPKGDNNTPERHQEVVLSGSDELHLYKDLLPKSDHYNEPEEEEEAAVEVEEDCTNDNVIIEPVLQTTGISWAVVGSNGTENSGAVASNSWQCRQDQDIQEHRDESSSSSSSSSESYEPPSSELVTSRRLAIESRLSELQTEQSSISCTASDHKYVVDLLHNSDMDSDTVRSLSPDLIKLMRCMYQKLLLEAELRDLS